MSVTGTITEQAALVTGLAYPAMGAGEGRNAPDDLGMWIFLGFCALIVAAQVIPMIRSVGRKGAESAAGRQAVEEKHQ